ncbi:MAG: hypothetical protein WBD95_25460 [Xanthobacteraceae bacterium]
MSAIEKQNAVLSFKRSNGRAYSGLAEFEALRRAREMLNVRDGDEYPQLFQCHAPCYSKSMPSE